MYAWNSILILNTDSSLADSTYQSTMLPYGEQHWINFVNCTLAISRSSACAPAPPTDNLPLRNVVSGHAHKATNGVLPEPRRLDSRLSYFRIMKIMKNFRIIKNCCIVDMRYEIELIYVPTTVRT